MTTSYFGSRPEAGSPLNSRAMRCRSADAFAVRALRTAIRFSGIPASMSTRRTQTWAAMLSTKTMWPQPRLASTRSASASSFGLCGSTSGAPAVFQVCPSSSSEWMATSAMRASRPRIFALSLMFVDSSAASICPT